MSFLFLLKKPNLRRLLTANFLSGIGDWFNSVAVLALLLEITGTAIAVGITLALRTLPHLIFGPLGGLMADRFDRKKVMVACDLVRGFVALSFLFVSEKSDVWMVYTGTFSLVAFSSLYNPARMSLLPKIVDLEELATANALDQSIYGIVMAIGSLIGGIFIALWGSDLAFLFNALSFFASALFLARLKVPASPNASVSNVQLQQSAKVSSYGEVIRAITSTPIVYAILLLKAVWPIGGGIINVLISVYAYQVFTAGEWGIGLLYGAIGIGFIIGGILAQRFQRYFYEVAASSFAVEGFGMLLTSFSPTIYVTALFFALSTVAGGMGNASLNTLIMRHVNPSYHGRVFALDATISNILIGLSMLLGGWILTMADPRIVGFVAGLLITIPSLGLGPVIWRTVRAGGNEPLANKNHAR
ncbi:MFS transporter [Brevibacillus brevis]|nr:MFS transporter [Brevibacillus brevis]